MSFSTYIRWLRLRRAMEVMSSGASLTTSAHEAGFTDSAHLNRICHSMFGLTPSAATAISSGIDAAPQLMLPAADLASSDRRL